MFIQLFTKLVPFVLHMNIFSLQRNTDDAAGYTISVGFLKVGEGGKIKQAFKGTQD
jgi:hypothetical protein